MKHVRWLVVLVMAWLTHAVRLALAHDSLCFSMLLFGKGTWRLRNGGGDIPPTIWRVRKMSSCSRTGHIHYSTEAQRTGKNVRLFEWNVCHLTIPLALPVRALCERKLVFRSSETELVDVAIHFLLQLLLSSSSKVRCTTECDTRRQFDWYGDVLKHHQPSFLQWLTTFV